MTCAINDPIDPRWAWEPYRPSDKNPWDLRKAGHLYRRASFGASFRELELAVRNGPEKTINSLLTGGPGQEAFDRQAEEMRQHIAGQNNQQGEPQARAWWLFRMLYTPHPLREKLALFWHNHFATSNAKVKSIRYMLDQNELLRRNALGSFRTMLHEISKDPAMMVWLDTNQSKKRMPNENYSRELMELFSLGIGNYTEDDVREGARAFTGWEIRNGTFFNNQQQFDATEKKYLGRTGNFTGEEVVDICLDQKSCPYFITGKLFKFFVSETIEPTRALLEPLASRFKQSGFDIAGVAATMLRSNLFFSPQAYRTRIKSPTDYALGILRALEAKLVEAAAQRKPGDPRVKPLALALALENLGQKLLAPPSVKGWDGGPAWINSTTLLLRQNLALALTSTEDGVFDRATDAAQLVHKYGIEKDEDALEFFIKLFLQGDLAEDSRVRLAEYVAKARTLPHPVYWTTTDVEEHRIRALCHLVLTQPEFQLD